MGELEGEPPTSSRAVVTGKLSEDIIHIINPCAHGLRSFSYDSTGDTSNLKFFDKEEASG